VLLDTIAQTLSVSEFPSLLGLSAPLGFTVQPARDMQRNSLALKELSATELA
jgi:hypothetical protein